MKKIILAALAVVSFTLASAQEENGAGFAKGDIFISGGFGFVSQKQGDNKTNRFEIAPRAGFFVSDDIAVGAQVKFESIKNENGSLKETDSEISLGAFGRYYFSPANKFSVFGQLEANYISSKDETLGQPDAKLNGFGLGLSPGLNYFISDNFALEVLWGILGYRTSKPDVDNAESLNTFELRTNLTNINIGLVYKF